MMTMTTMGFIICDHHVDSLPSKHVWLPYTHVQLKTSYHKLLSLIECTTIITYITATYYTSYNYNLYYVPVP